MKRNKLIKYLIASGCIYAREGSGHSIFINPAARKKTTVPRHTELDDRLAAEICKQLGIPKIRKGK